MYIARILYPVKVLGPGNRVAIWFSGCIHGCSGCSNPELWEQKPEHNISLEGLRKIIMPVADQYKIDGFTITGGDPFCQPEALKELIGYLRTISQDILVYTGYELEELSAEYGDILQKISVLIDGKYIEARNHGAMLKGSDNQRIIYIDKSMEGKYRQYVERKHRQIQNFPTSDGIISVGIHLPGYEEQLRRLTREKGLEET